MNASEERIKETGLDKQLTGNERITRTLFGGVTESLFCYETLQFPDYSRVVFDLFDPSVRIKRREEVFPKDLEKAFELGARLTTARPG
jgi:hypothetical protein